MLGITSPTITPFMFGNGCRSMIGGKAKELGMTKAMIVTDKVIAGTGILDAIYGSLDLLREYRISCMTVLSPILRIPVWMKAAG